MSTNQVKSTTSRKTPRVRTISRRFPQDHLCRYLLAGNRRCQRIAGCTGSGLCILHDRQLSQFRDAESRAVSHKALGKVEDLNTAISIHSVLSRVVILGLQRRYTAREVAVFTSAFRALQNSLDSASSELTHVLGYDARDPLIRAAIESEPSLHPCAERRVAIPTKSKRETATAPTPTPAQIAAFLQQQAATKSSQQSAAPKASVGAGLTSVGAGLDRDSGQAPPSVTQEKSTPPVTPPAPEPNTPYDEIAPPQPNSNSTTRRRFSTTPSAPDPDDGSIPFTHTQSYGGITVPLHGRLRKTQ